MLPSLNPILLESCSTYTAVYMYSSHRAVDVVWTLKSILAGTKCSTRAQLRTVVVPVVVVEQQKRSARPTPVIFETRNTRRMTSARHTLRPQKIDNSTTPHHHGTSSKKHHNPQPTSRVCFFHKSYFPPNLFLNCQLLNSIERIEMLCFRTSAKVAPSMGILRRAFSSVPETMKVRTKNFLENSGRDTHRAYRHS